MPPEPRTAVPAWAVLSSALAPVAMIGGWTFAQSLQTGFDPVEGTISALAAADASAPQVMTLGLALTGACHLVTAAGLRPLPGAARGLLALGGAATAAVAALPVDAWPRPHGLAAAVAFGALSLWPVGWVRRSPGEQALSPALGLGSAAVLAGLLAWFVLELQHLTAADGGLTGLSERVLAGAQSVWPLAVVLLLRRRVYPWGVYPTSRTILEPHR